MVGPKSTQTRVVGMIADEMHPYILFSSNGVSMKNVQGCISSFIIPTLLVCVLFGPTIPTYVFNLFSCFLYLFVLIFLSSIATESEGCDLVHLWHKAMHRHAWTSLFYPRNAAQHDNDSVDRQCQSIRYLRPWCYRVLSSRMQLARERHSGWSSDSVSDGCTGSSNNRSSPSKAPASQWPTLLTVWAQPTEVSPKRRF